MKNLDIIKFLLIMCGFYNNMKFDSWRCEDDITCWWYEWYGENDEGEVMMGSEPGLPMAINSIIKDIVNLKPDPSYGYLFYQMSVKHLLNDELRNKTINDEIKRLEDIDIDSYIRRDYYKWHKESRPCENCTINKKDFWSDMHYNCKEGYLMSCPILKEWLKEVEHKSLECKEKFNNLTEEERKEILKNYRKYSKTYKHLNEDEIMEDDQNDKQN